MDASTTAKLSRVEQCRKNARAKSEQKRQAAFDALATLQQEKRPITKAAVARRAGVSIVFLRGHADLLHAIEDGAKVLPTSPATGSSSDQAKDQVIAALRRRLDDLKQALAAKDAELRQKQREIDRLYGKLAATSPLTEEELRRRYQELLQRVAIMENRMSESV